MISMIRIKSVDNKPIHEIVYEYPEGAGRVATDRFCVFRAAGVGLPPPLQAVLVMSDIQGREPSWDRPGKVQRLLGEVIAEDLGVLSDLGDLPPRETIGVLLAGDLFVVPGLDKRGGGGDVSGIWDVFHDGFRWVAGTAGNHDRFGTGAMDTQPHFNRPNVHYLDAATVDVDGIRLGGVAGVIGKASKPFRREERDFIAAIERVMAQTPDVLVLHEGPSGRSPERPGHDSVREVLERTPQTLVVCGHVHWPGHDVEELANGTQVVNADAKAFLIEATNE